MKSINCITESIFMGEYHTSIKNKWFANSISLKTHAIYTLQEACCLSWYWWNLGLCNLQVTYVSEKDVRCIIITKRKLFNFIENIILVTILYHWDIHIVNTSLLHSETTPVKQIYSACYKSDTKIEGYLRFYHQLHEHQTYCCYHILYYEHTDMHINVQSIFQTHFFISFPLPVNTKILFQSWYHFVISSFILSSYNIKSNIFTVSRFQVSRFNYIIYSYCQDIFYYRI